jgi:hypothetical protein
MIAQRWMGALMAATAAATAAAAPAPETPAASAKRFVDRLYGNIQPPVPDAQTYAPELNRLVQRAEAIASKTEDADLVGNPLCDCQDVSELRNRITVVSATPTAASVRVALTGGVDGPASFLLKLVRTPAGWRLADAVNATSGSYADYLRKAIAGQ